MVLMDAEVVDAPLEDADVDVLQPKLVGFDLVALWTPTAVEYSQLHTVVGLLFCWRPRLSSVGEPRLRAVTNMTFCN